jgi:hypothetical protein
MAGSRTLKLTYLGDASQLSRTTQTASKDIDSLGDRARNFGKKAAIAFAAVGTAAIAVGRSLFTAFEEVSTANARVENIIGTMGNFEGQLDAVSRRVLEVAESTALLTGVDRNLIKESQALLLTFDSVNKTADTAGGVFDRATAAAVDLAAAGFGTVSSNATQLGKALEDPIKGLTALTRSGVTFTDEQKELIRTLVESNRTLEAQEVILSAIETQVGGTAEATANGSARISQAFGILKERIATQLAPAFETLTTKALELIDKGFVWWEQNGEDVIDKLTRVGGAIRDAAVATADYVKVEVLPRFVELWQNIRQPLIDARIATGELKDAIDDLARSLGGENQSAFAYFLDWGFRLAEIKFTRLIEGFTDLARAITAVAEAAKRVRDGGLPGVPSLGGAADLPPGFVPGTVAPTARSSAANITVNVSGAIDPEGTARTIRRVLEESTRRVGAPVFV